MKIEEKLSKSIRSEARVRTKSTMEIQIRRANGPRRVRSCAKLPCNPASKARNAGKQSNGLQGSFCFPFLERKGAALGGIWAVNTRFALPSSRPRATLGQKKSDSKSTLHFGRLLASQMLLKATQNDAQNLEKIIKK